MAYTVSVIYKVLVIIVVAFFTEVLKSGAVFRFVEAMVVTICYK